MEQGPSPDSDRAARGSGASVSGRNRARSWRRRLKRGLAGGLLASLCLAIPASAPNAAPIEVAIFHSRAFDAACSLLRGYAIDPGWRDQLEAMLPDLREAWSREGRPILDRVFQLTGKALHGRHNVQLTLCDIPSSSRLGTIVNMRHALPAFTDDPVPLRYKAAIISHELLHRLLAGLDLSRGRMLAAHAREPWAVRSHLHLFALVKAALLELGRPDVLEELERIDSRLPEAGYRRAWEIVNASPNAYLFYVEEVRRAH